MNYQTLMDIISVTKRAPVLQTHEVVKNLYHLAKKTKNIDDFDVDESDEYKSLPSYKYYISIYKLANLFLEQSAFVGTSDDFHNLTVEFATHADYDYACKILEKGLSTFPRSVDLLADYLAYCTEICVQDDDFIEKGNKYYKVLESIDKSEWNWRAFSFTIDFLISKKEKENVINNNDNTIKNLVEEYKTRFPYDERSYIEEYRLLEKSDSDKLRCKAMLESVINGETKVKRAYRVAFKLANLYFEDKQYDEALKMVERYVIDSIDERPSSNRGIIYLLSALCKLSKFYSNHPEQNLTIDPNSSEGEFIKSIYSDFSSSKFDDTNSKYDRLLPLIQILNLQTKITNDYDDDANVSNVL